MNALNLGNYLEATPAAPSEPVAWYTNDHGVPGVALAREALGPVGSRYAVPLYTQPSTKPAGAGECAPNSFLSCACAKGTKCCPVDHRTSAASVQSGWIERAIALAEELAASVVRESFTPGGFADARENLRAHLLAQAAITERMREALELALRSHDMWLASDPPQEAWKAYRVHQIASDALRTYEAHQKGTA